MGQARDEAGNVWETDAQGNAIRLVRAAGAPQMPADPTFPYQGAQAQAQAANTGADAAVNQATIPAQITSANADATAKTRTASTAGLPEGFMWSPDGKTAVPIPGYTRQGLSPEVRSAAMQAFTDADALERNADLIEQRFNEGPGATSGIRGAWDFFPSVRNSRFDESSQRTRGYVKRSLGFTGGEGNTIAESSALYDPYLPNSWDFNSTAKDKIAALRQLAADARAKATRTLGGTPDANGNIVPADNRPNALTMPRIINSGPGAAEFGATEGGDLLNPQYQSEYEAFVRRGNFTPQSYAQFRNELDRKFGYAEQTDPALYETEGGRILETLQKGGTLNLTIPPKPRELSTLETIRNSAVSNPVGAAAAGFLDMGGFGGVTALAPQQMAALSEAEPTAMTLGQVGGSIAGTSALGRLGAQTAGRLLPSLLGGGAKAKFARDLATDVAYSGIHGGVTEGDPLTGAALGGVGSLGGQAVARTAGRMFGGVNLTPAVTALRNRGIPMTVPQQLGGFVKNVEDKAMSLPLVGDMIRNRRLEGLDAFNREAFREAGGPIQATANTIGQEGVEQLGDLVSDAYTNATAGASVPFDPTFATDFSAAVGRGQRLPPDLRGSLADILDARVAPITDTGFMTGDQFQQAMRALKATRNRPPSRFEGFEQDYRDAVTGVMDALEGQMMRGGADSTVTGLQSANAANRNLRTIEDATRRAAGGSETGTPFVFTPSQLQRAGIATEKRYPGARPFGDLADAGQEVLPSRVPNSGTADRAAQMLLPSAIVGGGAGLGTLASGDLQGAGTGAGVSTLATLALLAGGTKTGQKAAQKLLIDRPQTMKMLGNAIRNRAGIFGSAALPFALTDY